MEPLITGSLAYDNLMHICGRFQDRLPAQPSGGFSAAYLTPSLSRVRGGCAGNIAYALHMLGDAPTVMATAGSDFPPYADYLTALGISTAHIMVLEDFYTAQAYIVTDEENNQFIVFHPGACGEAHRQRISSLPTPPPMAIVSPNGKEGMLQHSRDLAAAGVPFIFDPGQAIGMFSGEELEECLTLAPYAIFNESEFATAQQTTGLTADAAAAMTDALFVTDGERGSRVLVGGEVLSAECVRVGETKDPTGCGDAYRAGLIHGLLNDMDLVTACRIGSIMGAIKIEHLAPQHHRPEFQEIADRFEAAYGYRF